jgi:epsilon-lactone hydrolase
MRLPSHLPAGEGKGRARIAVMQERHKPGQHRWAIISGMDDDRERLTGKLAALPPAPDAIKLRHLRAFVAVAEELNFSKAASRLYLSQPALSRQIRALERLVGCDLLRRSTHQVELTLAGEALLDRARQILRDLDDAVAATRSVGGELAGRIAQFWEPFTDLTVAEESLQEWRTAYEALHAQFPPLPEVEVQPVNAGGVPSLLLTPQPEQPITMLYLHGGGYVAGSAFGYRSLVGALAAAAEAGVLVPEYRLAPEHPFPAALEDALAVYLWMLDRGTDPRRVTVAGDSSGGGLALSLLLSLKQQALPLPAGAVLLCPGVDLTGGLPRLAPHELELVRHYAAIYLAGHPADNPVVSPLTADLRGLPPMLIQAATGDAFLEEASQLTARAREHGVDARLDLYPVDTHVFHTFWSFLPEAADALQQAGRFVRDLHATQPDTRSRSESS